MSASWLLPGVKTLYNNRQEVFNTWDRMVARVLGPKSRVAFVGPQGIGKTVLLDALVGRTLQDDYHLPHRSNRLEVGKAKSDGNRMGIVVAPGQGRPEQYAFDEIFNGKKTVDGVVFVAGAGFATLRDKTARAINVEKGITTIQQWRELQYAAELEYLQKVATRIEQSQQQAQMPKWLLIAATKIDLFYDDIAIAQQYYSPDGDSEFSKILNGLVNRVGSNNLTWDAVPVSSWLENFTWNNETQKSQLDADARNHYVASFVKKLGDMCHD